LKIDSLKSDSFWSIFGNAAGSSLALIAGIIVARFLGKDIYGEYGMIKSTLVNVAIFSTFGLGITATKFIAEAKNRQHTRKIVFASTKITLVTSILFALLLFVFSKQIAAYLNAEHLWLALRIFAVNIVFNAVSTVQIGILAGFKAFKQIAINNGITGVATFILSVVLTYYWNIEGALSALLVATLLACVLNNVVVRRKLCAYPHSEECSDSIVKQLFRFSFPVALQEGVHALTVWLQMVLLIKLTNYGEAGLFSAAHQWVMVVLFIPGVLKNVALSHLSGVNDDAVEHKKVFNRIVRINFIATLIPCLLVFAFSGFIAAFYGESFARLPLVLSIAVFSAVFMSAQYVYIQRYMSINKIWTNFCLSTVFNVLTLVLAFLLISRNPEKGAEILVSILLIISVVRLLAYHLVMRVKKYKI
jgi:O-antigen/teichoic acid export membrane protein